MLGQQRLQPDDVTAVEDLAADDLGLEPGPAGEPALTCHGQLRHGQAGLTADRGDSGQRGRVAAPGRPQQVLGLAAKLVEVGALGKVGHDISSSGLRSAVKPKEIVSDGPL